MNDLLTHIDIKINAAGPSFKGLDAETYDLYEMLVQPFVRPARERMYMNLSKSTVGQRIECSMHVYGRCVLDADLRRAVFELVGHVPEAHVTLSHGVQTVETPFLRYGADDKPVRRSMIEDRLKAGGDYQVVLTGTAHDKADDAPPLKVVA